MEKNNDFSLLKQLLSDLFGVNMSTPDEILKSEESKDLEKNFNKVEEISETDTHTVKRERWVDPNGQVSFTRIITTVKAQPKDDKVTIERLEKCLDECIRKQEFEEAARIRDEIKVMKKK
jgi:excinuclease UvrABC helicase subunit UvrB